MIQKTQAFKTSNNKTFETLAAAQEEELAIIIAVDEEPSKTERDIANKLLNSANTVIDILSTNENSRVKARKANGATRKKKGAQQGELVKT